MSSRHASKGRSAQKISVSNELHLVSCSIDGMRLLTKQWTELHFTEEELPGLANALHATLVLVRERLALVDSAVRDVLDPRHMLCAENDATGEEMEGGDLTIPVWSAQKSAPLLRQHAEQAERNLQHMTKGSR